MDASRAVLINAMALKDMISALKQTFLDVEPHVSRLADGIAQLYRLRPEAFHVFVEGPFSNEYGEPEDTLFCLLAKYGRPNALRRVIECARSLLERDPHLDQAGRDGETPLMLACKRGNIACVEVLLESEFTEVEVLLESEFTEVEVLLESELIEPEVLLKR
jgi:hypothetical protein